MSGSGVLMDLYEPTEMRRALLKLGIQVTVSCLSAGDYVLSPSICIERKTVQDFLSSMYSGRLGYQLQLLTRSFANPFLLVEGRPENCRRILNIKSFYGYLSRLIISGSMGLLQTPDMPTSALLISLMTEKSGSSPPPPRLRPGGKKRSDSESILLILESFPGIGPVLSERLLAEFGSLRSILQASEDSLSRVKGVGSSKAKKMLEIMDCRIRTSPESSPA